MKSRNEFASDEAYEDYLEYYYAGQMMQALISNPEASGRPNDFAEAACKHARALLVELNKSL